MEGSGSRLATAGEDLKIWGSPSFSLVHQFTPSSTSHVSSNCWSPDTTCVASVLKGKEQILLTYCKKAGGGYTSQEVPLHGIGRPNVIQFPKTNQNQVVLAIGSSLHVYDLSRGKTKKSFSLKSQATCLAVNHCDAYFAAGCSDGSLVLATNASNQVASPMVAPKCAGQKITSVRYSSVRPSLLGTSCESGVVSFWDCNASKNLFNLAPHCSPATDLAFSPINDALALSVGLDKRLVCCDSKVRKPIRTIECDQPLTTCAFDLDGVTMAVGSSRGKVLIYDLRALKAPCVSMDAHNSAVHSLQYQHRVETKASSQAIGGLKGKGSHLSKTRSGSKLREQKSVSGLVTVEEEGKENLGPEVVNNLGGRVEKDGVVEEIREEKEEWMGEVRHSPSPGLSRRDSISSQLFSPLRETDISFPGTASKTAEPKRVSGEPRRVSEVRLSSDGLFSPLRDFNSPNSSRDSSLQQSFKKSGSAFPTPIMSPLNTISEEAVMASSPAVPVNIRDTLQKARTHPEKLSLDRLDEFVKAASSGDRSPEFAPREMAEEEALKSNVFKINNPHNISGKNALVCSDKEEATSPGPTIVKPDFSRSALKEHSDFNQVLQAFPSVVLTDTESSGSSSLLLPEGSKHSFTSNSASKEGQRSFSTMVDPASASRVANKVAEALVGTDSGLGEGAANFQRGYISNVVSDAMEEWCTGLERRLWAMQYSLLRQLDQHQAETRQLVAQTGGLDDLRAEVERLRLENAELRKAFGDTGVNLN